MKRRTILLGALPLGAAALTIGISVASGTPGLGTANSYVARGTVGDQLLVGMPSTVTVTRTVRVKTKRGPATARVKLTVPSAKALISCAAAPCDTVFQQLTIGPGGYTGWHTHPGPTFVAVAQGEGNDVPRSGVGVHGRQVRPRLRVPPALHRDTQHEERGLNSSRPACVLRPTTRDAGHGDQGRPGAADELPGNPIDSGRGAALAAPLSCSAPPAWARGQALPRDGRLRRV